MSLTERFALVFAAIEVLRMGPVSDAMIDDLEAEVMFLNHEVKTFVQKATEVLDACSLHMALNEKGEE